MSKMKDILKKVSGVGVIKNFYDKNLKPNKAAPTPEQPDPEATKRDARRKRARRNREVGSTILSNESLG